MDRVGFYLEPLFAMLLQLKLKVMTPKERSESLKWFSHLDQSTREKLANNFFYFKDESIATGREIHQLYLELKIQNR